MEAITLLGLVGMGYLVAKTSSPSPLQNKKEKEGFNGNNNNQNFNQNQNPNQNPNQVGSVQYGPVIQQRPSDRPLPPNSVLNKTAKGASAVGTGSELDMMYKTSGGQTYPSEPVPGPFGPPLGYASQKPPTAPRYNNSPSGLPTPESIDAAKSSVTMNPPGVEKNPIYGGNTYITSELTGKQMQTDEFTHNNMVPFFGGSVKQNVAVNTNNSLLDSFTGAGSTDIRKQEVKTMFNTAQTPFGNPFGMEDNTDFFQSRMNDSRSRDGEKPFEPTRVGAAVGEKYGQTGKGGFQQFDINEIMKRAMPTTEKLRVADDPKLTYNTPVIPGKRYITAGPNNPGEVRKYKPDTFYVDEAGERFVGAFSEESQREPARSLNVFKFVTRPETSSEFIGPAASQDAGQSYVAGEYRTPMAQQYGGAGFRNADMTTYYTKDVAGPESDYGKSSIEIRPNERLATQDRTMALNMAPSDMGLGYVRTDDVRPTRRAETVGNIRQTATPVGYAGGAPSITVWDPTDVARTTVKETTINWNVFGIASSADAPTKLKVYDPDDIARPTQKAQISAKSEYFGAGDSVRKDFTSHVAAYNMRTNPNKEQIAKGRKPIAGSGLVGTLNGTVNQTTKKLNADIINDRALTVNNVSGLTPGSGDIGQVKYRYPLKLDVSLERNQPSMISAVENNPLQQSLRRNAETDERYLNSHLH